MPLCMYKMAVVNSSLSCLLFKCAGRIAAIIPGALGGKIQEYNSSWNIAGALLFVERSGMLCGGNAYWVDSWCCIRILIFHRH